MANRTFKVYGQAYASSGDVTAVLSVGGVEVFNGAVSDSTTVRSGPPTTSNLLFSYTLDEATTGTLAYSLTVAGGELCLGPTHYNYAEAQVISSDWVAANIPDLTNVSADAQTHIASTLGETALTTAYYNELVAGTAGTPSDAQTALFQAANMPATSSVYVISDDTRASAQIDSVAMVDWDDDAVSKINWPVLEDGSVFTCTLTHVPDTYHAVV